MFRQSTRDRINGWGSVFRFITPIMIILIGYLGKMAVGDIKSSISRLNTHFTNHLSDHKNIELVIEKRLTCIETILRDERRRYENW